MNERIDKLLVKAGAYFGGEGVVYDTFDPKKFAELIVGECVRAADEWYQYHNEIQWDPGEHIKQHFGVSE